MIKQFWNIQKINSTVKFQLASSSCKMATSKSSMPVQAYKNQKKLNPWYFCTLVHNSFVSLKQSAVALLSTFLRIPSIWRKKSTTEASNHLSLCWCCTKFTWKLAKISSRLAIFTKIYEKLPELKVCVLQFHDFRVVFCHNVSLKGER